MNQNYVELFSIDCRHAYFADNVGRPVYLTPTADCVDLMRRYGLRLRNRVGGCALYYDPAEPYGLLGSFDETVPFNFMLGSSDPYLFNYTDWPLSAAPSAATNISLFDNRQDISDGLLHLAGAPFSAAALPVRTGPFMQPVAQPVRGVEVSLRGGLDGRPMRQYRLPNQLQSQVAVDTCGLPCGPYELWVADNRELEFCLCDSSIAHRWGMVSIYAGGVMQTPHLPNGRYPIDADGQINPQKYQIVFASRSTIWRYYLISRTSQSAGGTVTLNSQRNGASDATQDVQFVKLNRTMAVNGIPATVFESQQPLPLLQSPDSDLQLSFHADSSMPGGATDVSLPCPGPGALAADRDEPQLLRSDMYVYL